LAPTVPGYRVYKDDDTKLMVYRERVRRAKQELDRHKKWVEEGEKRYAGEPFTGQRFAAEHAISTEDCVAVIDSMYSALTAWHSDFVVTPLGTGTQEQARLTEQALRQELRMLDMNAKTDRAIKQAMFADIGYVKVSYEYSAYDTVEPKTEDELALEVDDLNINATSAGLPLVRPDQAAELINPMKPKTVVERDQIVLDFVPHDSVLFDDCAESWEDLRWICQVTKLRPEEVKDNDAWREHVKKYGSLKKLDELEADSRLKTDDGKKDDPDGGMVTVYEMWDLDSGMVCTFVESLDFLIGERENPFGIFHERVKRNPFVPFRERIRTKGVRGVSTMRVIRQNLEEEDIYRSRAATYIDRFVPKVFMSEDLLKDSTKTAIQSREYAAIAPIAQGHNPNQEIMVMSPPVLPSEVFQMVEKLKLGVRDASGVTDMMQGRYAGNSPSATESMAVQQGGSVRQAEKMTGLERFYEEIARKVLALMQVFYDAPRIARMVEHEEDVEWEWTNEDIVEDYFLDVHLSPKESETRQAKRDFALQVLNLIMPLAGPGAPIDAVSAIKWALGEMGLRQEIIRTIINTDQEMQQQAQEQQQSQQEAEVQSAQAQAAMDPKVLAAMAQSNVRPTTEAGVQGERTDIIQRT
jgi:hypothetical protein